MFLADSTAKEVFGTIAPVGPIGTFTISTLFGWGLRLFLFGMGMLALYYMLMAALDWITAAGEEKKIESARYKLTQSMIALSLTIAILVGWIFVSTQILGIFKIENGQISIKIPSINCKPAGAVFTAVSDCCSGSADPTAATKCK